MTLLTLTEVAERLRVSRRTVEREIAKGYLRTVGIGSRRLVSLRELEAYVAARSGRKTA